MRKHDWFQCLSCQLALTWGQWIFSHLLNPEGQFKFLARHQYARLLFLLYIHDLPNCNLLSDVRMYADDTNLTFASKDPEDFFLFLTHDLSNVKQWLDSNRLSLNVLKTKCLFKGTRYKISLLPSEPHICLDGRLIERFNSYKCLARWNTLVGSKYL